MADCKVAGSSGCCLPLAVAALTLLLLSAQTCCGTRPAHPHVRHTKATAELPLKVITVSTKEQAGGELITNLLESCSPRYNITVLGEEGAYFAGHTTKAMLMIKHLRELDPNQLVLFLDSDLRCFPCTRDLVELFLSQSADIVMAADFDGFPDFWKEPWFPPVPEGLPPKARRYVNSGTYIGRAHSIQAVLVKYMLQHGQHMQQKELHDQRLFQDVYLSQYYSPGPTGDPSLALDYAGYYFQTFDNRDTCWQQRLPSKQVWCADIYKAEACILHTAGAKRHFYDVLIPRWKANETIVHPDPVKA